MFYIKIFINNIMPGSLLYSNNTYKLYFSNEHFNPKPHEHFYNFQVLLSSFSEFSAL